MEYRRVLALLPILAVTSLACTTSDGKVINPFTGALTAPTPVASPPPPPPAPSPLEITPREVNLDVPQQAQLTASVTDAPIAWRSERPNVATVSETGLVACLGAGSTAVEARTVAGEPRSAQVVVTCRDDIRAEVTPGGLAFVHTVGHDPCAQRIGFITVKMVGGPYGLVAFYPDDPSVVVSAARYTRLDRNGEARFEVLFNCGRQTSFTARIRVSVGDELSATDYVVTVTGTIIR